jgi:hypothetical protein
MVDPDPAKLHTEAQPGRQAAKVAAAATAAMSTPASEAEEAAVVLTEVAAAAAMAVTPEGADTASTNQTAGHI